MTAYPLDDYNDLVVDRAVLARSLRLDPDDLDDTTATEDVQAPARHVVLTPASAIAPRRVHWLWEGRIAAGTIALLAGGEGLGKSTLGYWLAARITRGELPGENLGDPRGVLVCATEDSWAHTIVPRLMAAGADLDRVYRVEVLTADAVHADLSLPRDLEDTARAARETRAALLLLDPLMSRLDASLDAHRDGEVRRALEPLARLADLENLAVVGLIHHNKSGSTDPLALVMASKAFTAVARSVHSVIRDPDDEERRLFGTPKNNLGRTDLPTLAFTITGYAVDTQDGTAWTGRLVWGGQVAGTIREAMARAAEPNQDRTAAGRAATWLREHLESCGGSAPSRDVKTAAEDAGHSGAALRRARERLALAVASTGFPAISTWSLPDDPDDSDGARNPEPTTTAVVPPSGATSPRGEDTTSSTSTTGVLQGKDDRGGATVGPSRASRASGAPTPRPRATTGDARAVCTVCATPMRVLIPGHHVHPMCEQAGA